MVFCEMKISRLAFIVSKSFKNTFLKMHFKKLSSEQKIHEEGQLSGIIFEIRKKKINIWAG